MVAELWRMAMRRGGLVGNTLRTVCGFRNDRRGAILGIAARWSLVVRKVRGPTDVFC